MVSLKRTLLSDLASSIEVINPINQASSKSNLHTPLRYSAVLLSIGKTTHICHQNIPLKKLHRKETITYVSAISRKLANIWQQPTDKIASNLLTVLHNRATSSVWSSIRQNEDGWIEFVISQRGIDQWQQQLTLQTLPRIGNGLPPYALGAQKLWQLQAGYELCCRWQAAYQQMGGIPEKWSDSSSSRPFRMSDSPLDELIHGLLDICDGWDQATLPQLSTMSQQLVAALGRCTGTTTPASPAAGAMNRWLVSTQVVLKQLVNGRLGYQLTKCF